MVSGGQTGADVNGLKAAKALGIETGGWAPKGYLTEKGSDLSLKELYNLQETESSQYPPRTKLNVLDSDGTIRFAFDFKTAGEKCTYNAIKWYSKPHFDVNLNKPLPVEEAYNWLVENQIKILNVAGNRESTHPGVGELTEKYLLELLS